MCSSPPERTEFELLSSKYALHASVHRVRPLGSPRTGLTRIDCDQTPARGAYSPVACTACRIPWRQALLLARRGVPQQQIRLRRIYWNAVLVSPRALSYHRQKGTPRAAIKLCSADARAHARAGLRLAAHCADLSPLQCNQELVCGKITLGKKCDSPAP